MVVVTPVSLLTPNNDADLPTRTSVFGYASTAMIFVAVLSAAVALPLRLRRAGGEQRQQLRWVAMSGSLIVLAILFQVAVAVSGRNPADVWYADLPIFLAYLTVPVATGARCCATASTTSTVILGRALLLGALLTFVTVGYVSVVVLLGAFVGPHVGATFWASLLATAVVALAFQPLRRRSAAGRPRRVRRARVPYEALGSSPASSSRACRPPSCSLASPRRQLVR
jgi:hypothetical protein